MTAAMVVPGLFEVPGGAIDKLDAPKLQFLLSRAQSGTISQICYEAVLGSLLGGNDKRSGYLPVAAIERQESSDPDSATRCVRADPVHLQVNRDHARLLPTSLLTLADEESVQLADMINGHFRGDGLHLEIGDAQRWYLCADSGLDVDMKPPGYATGRNVNHFMPTGASSARWRSFLTETQMLLHNHPVNMTRVAAGKLPVNSLWLWGGGQLPVVNGVDAGTVVSDAVLPARLAYITGADHCDVLDLESALQRSGKQIIVTEDIYQAAILGDAEQWLSAVDDFEQRYLQVAIAALKKRQIDNISLYPCDGSRWDINRGTLRKFWRRRKAMQDLFSSREGSL